MNKRTIAIITEIIPIVSAILSFVLLATPNDSRLISLAIAISFLLSFLGFVFFFVGRKLAKDDKMVRVLGILDWLATLSIVVIYLLAIFCFGL